MAEGTPDTIPAIREDSTELLSQLRGIQLPEQIAQPSPWPALAAAALVICCLIAWALRIRHRRVRWAAHARDEINQLSQQPPDIALQGYALLLKRIVVTADDQPEIRRLHGKPWLDYLNRFFHTRYFTKDAGQIFGETVYIRLDPSAESVIKLADAQARQLKKLIRRRSFWPW